MSHRKALGCSSNPERGASSREVTTQESILKLFISFFCLFGGVFFCFKYRGTISLCFGANPVVSFAQPLALLLGE